MARNGRSSLRGGGLNSIRIWVKIRGKPTTEMQHDAAREGRRTAAAERAREELGVIIQHDGRYKCGFEGCSKLGSLRTMRTHVVACESLTVEQRQAQTSVREGNTARQSEQGAPRRAASRPVVTQSVTRRRVRASSDQMRWDHARR